MKTAIIMYFDMFILLAVVCVLKYFLVTGISLAYYNRIHNPCPGVFLA